MHKHMHAAQSSPFPLSDIDALAAGRLRGQPSAVPTLSSARRYRPRNLLFSTLPLSSLSRPFPRSPPLRTSYFVSLRLSSVLLHYTHSYSCNSGAHAPLTLPFLLPPIILWLSLTPSITALVSSSLLLPERRGLGPAYGLLLQR